MREKHFNSDSYTITDNISGEEVNIKFFINEIKEAGKWHKAYAETLAVYVGIQGNKSTQVLAYLVKNISNENYIYGTVREIADNIGTTPKVVNNVFNTLKKMEYLKRVRNGCYILSPKIISTGSNFQGSLVLNMWGSIK